MSPDRVNERRRCVAWLHARADSMNDEHARQILHSAATNLGWTKGKPLPDAADKGEAEVRQQEQIREDTLDGLFVKAEAYAEYALENCREEYDQRWEVRSWLEMEGAMLPEERARSRAQGGMDKGVGD